MAPRRDDPEMITALQHFIDALREAGAIDESFSERDRDRILGLTGIAAHSIVRPAGPFASLAAGYLLGASRAGSWGEAIDEVQALVRAYTPEQAASASGDESMPGAPASAPEEPAPAPEGPASAAEETEA